MPRLFATIARLLPFAIGLLTFCLVAAASAPSYWLVDIDNLGSARLQIIKNDSAVAWWVEAGDQLLVYGQPRKAQELHLRTKRLDIAAVPDKLRLAKQAHSRELFQLGADVLVKGGRKAIIQLQDERASATPLYSDILVTAFVPNSILARQNANEPQSNFITPLPIDPNTEAALGYLSRDRWFADVTYLSTLNRFSRGPGVLVARDWFKQQFETIPNLDVSLLDFDIQGTRGYDVVAVLKGTERPDDVYVVGGHYDSISEAPTRVAPGAEDNGTGSAAVLEMARVLAEHPPKATIVFIVYSGEEQNLYGSKAHVRKLMTASELEKVKAVITMDMIGYSKTPGDLTVLLETRELAAPFMEELRQSALAYTTLHIMTTFDAWGSDHIPYLDKNIKTVLTIDNDYEDYPSYHQSSDLPNMVVPEMGYQILRMNTATFLRLAGS